MINIIIGAVFMAGFLFLVEFSRKKKIHLKWWQWLLTILEFIYACFVIQMIVSFLSEESPKAALVMGLIFGFIAVIGGVLLQRFIFTVKKAK